MNGTTRDDQHSGERPATAAATRGDAASADPARSMLGPALHDIRTVLPGMVPFGVLLGVTIVGTGSDRIAGIVGALTVYGGSAQVTAVTLADRGLDLVGMVAFRWRNSAVNMIAAVAVIFVLDLVLL